MIAYLQGIFRNIFTGGMAQQETEIIRPDDPAVCKAEGCRTAAFRPAAATKEKPDSMNETGFEKAFRLLFGNISGRAAIFANRQGDDLVALGHDGGLDVVAVLQRIGEVNERSAVFHYGINGDGDLLFVGQFALSPGLWPGGFLFLQGNVLGGFTGLVDDGDAHLCGFFFGFFLLGTGGENGQRRYEDQNQCNQLFSFLYLPFSFFLSVSFFFHFHGCYPAVICLYGNNSTDGRSYSAFLFCRLTVLPAHQLFLRMVLQTMFLLYSFPCLA